MKELAARLPHSRAVNRGKKSIDGLAAEARAGGFTRILLITDAKGNPAALQSIAVEEDGWVWTGPKITISGLRLDREFEAPMRERAGSIGIRDEIGFAGMIGIEPDESPLTLVAGKERICFELGERVVGPLIKIGKVVPNA